jgi:hypothetical protein
MRLFLELLLTISKNKMHQKIKLALQYTMPVLFSGQTLHLIFQSSFIEWPIKNMSSPQFIILLVSEINRRSLKLLEQIPMLQLS